MVPAAAAVVWVALLMALLLSRCAERRRRTRLFPIDDRTARVAPILVVCTTYRISIDRWRSPPGSAEATQASDTLDRVSSAATSSPLLAGLNPVQAEAVTHEGGPLLIIAGAGSGKTRVLTHRVAWLVTERHISPFEILAITFTNKAADEMRSRVTALIGPVAQRMWVSTFHSACVRILRRDAGRLGYKSSFTIYDQADAVRLVGYVLRDLNIDSKRFPPRTVHAIISAAKNELIDFEAYASTARTIHERRIAEVYREYQRRLLAASAMDFDDLLLVTVNLFQACPDVLAHYQHRFKHVLVDEYQDTNRAQNELVVMLSREHRNICVVGDSDQSVYRFRGADIRNILQFEDAFPDATVIVLEQNYRSTQTILDAANAVIANNAMRKPKALWTEQIGGELITRYHAEDEHDEGAWVAAEIARLPRHHRRRRARRAPLRVGRHRRLLPDQRPEPSRRGGAGPAQHSLQGRRRHQVLRPAGDQGSPGLPAGRGQPA